jgi:hypothetical protein
MTAKKGTGVRWCTTPVVLREDLLQRARAEGMDINDLCNRALAGATGITYLPGKPAAPVPAEPVIVADKVGKGKEEIPPPAIRSEDIHPVINADDPRSATVVKQVIRASSPKVPPALPGRVSPPEKAPQAPEPIPAVKPEKKPGTHDMRKETKGKGNVIKRFVTDALIREDTDNGNVSKEELYQAFSRWCREHRISPVPDRRALTVTLKNQFAMKEQVIDGEPSWMNIRIR